MTNTPQDNADELEIKLAELKSKFDMDEFGTVNENGFYLIKEVRYLIQARELEAEKRGRLKQTRKILQHEKDVWEASRNESYMKAEIKRLTTKPQAGDGEGA